MIIEPEETAGAYSYQATEQVYYITWISAESWTLGNLNNATINTPFKLFIQTAFTTEGRNDLITHVENYTP